MVLAKADMMNGRRRTINKAHDKCNARPTPGIKQKLRNTTYGICSAFKRTAMRLLTNKKQVMFGVTNISQATGQAHKVHLTYDSRADGH